MCGFCAPPLTPPLRSHLQALVRLFPVPCLICAQKFLTPLHGFSAGAFFFFLVRPPSFPTSEKCGDPLAGLFLQKAVGRSFKDLRWPAELAFFLAFVPAVFFFPFCGSEKTAFSFSLVGVQRSLLGFFLSRDPLTAKVRCCICCSLVLSSACAYKRAHPLICLPLLVFRFGSVRRASPRSLSCPRDDPGVSGVVRCPFRGDSSFIFFGNSECFHQEWMEHRLSRAL